MLWYIYRTRVSVQTFAVGTVPTMLDRHVVRTPRKTTDEVRSYSPGEVYISVEIVAFEAIS